MHQPQQDHWDVVLWVLQYIKSTLGHGLLLRDLKLCAFCNSDWASCPIAHCSMTGFFVSLGHSPISWRSKKQHTISRSSAEAKNTTLWLTHVASWNSFILFCMISSSSTSSYAHVRDNQETLHICSNLIFYEWTKHIEVGYHFVRRELQSPTNHSHLHSYGISIYRYLHQRFGADTISFFLGKLGIYSLHVTNWGGYWKYSYLWKVIRHTYFTFIVLPFMYKVIIFNRQILD